MSVSLRSGRCRKATSISFHPGSTRRRVIHNRHGVANTTPSEATEGKPLIHIPHANVFRFGEAHRAILRDVRWTVRDGDAWAVIGSGDLEGKSALLDVSALHTSHSTCGRPARIQVIFALHAKEYGRRCSAIHVSLRRRRRQMVSSPHLSYRAPLTNKSHTLPFHTVLAPLVEHSTTTPRDMALCGTRIS
jgi:ABC-type molybdenum transport system ATPase subunit/photorepair protein PhrA